MAGTKGWPGSKWLPAFYPSSEPLTSSLPWASECLPGSVSVPSEQGEDTPAHPEETVTSVRPPLMKA